MWKPLKATLLQLSPQKKAHRLLLINDLLIYRDTRDLIDTSSQVLDSEWDPVPTAKETSKIQKSIADTDTHVAPKVRGIARIKLRFKNSVGVSQVKNKVSGAVKVDWLSDDRSSRGAFL